MKKIVFFDGDGTLWYPKATKYTRLPHWVYSTPKTAKDPNKHLMLTPTALSTIKKLKAQGMYLVILSTNPYPPEKANAIMKERINYFQLQGLFDEVHATPTDKASKGEYIIEILKRTGFAKSQALMVGDSYEWDYLSARNSKIDALLIESNYRKELGGARTKRVIKGLRDVLNYLSNI